MNTDNKNLWSPSNLDSNRPIHMAGIAGSAMSGLALMLRQRGFKITGTDPNIDKVKARLESAGIQVDSKQDGALIDKQTQLVIATAALPADHPELKKARLLGTNTISYAQALGGLMSESYGVAVAGTHGKTTTSTMIISILKSAGIDPGFVIGGVIPSFGIGSDNGDPSGGDLGHRLFVAEACEFNRSFLNLWPRIAVITNIEEDHLDVYENLDAIKDAFCRFGEHVPHDGLLIYSADCPNTPQVVEQLNCPKLSFGIDKNANISAENLTITPLGTRFDLYINHEDVGQLELPQPGRHNVANALAAIAVCHHLGLSIDEIRQGALRFLGVHRRFEIHGEINGITIVDDFAHHPTEIRALLEGARSHFKDRRIIVVFQPHQSSRTRLMLDEFAASMGAADSVIVVDIFHARDSADEKRSVSAQDLFERIVTKGIDARYIGSLSQAADYLENETLKGDVVITVGAGNINRVAEDLLRRITKNPGL